MTIRHYGNQEYQGLSSDTKPIADDTAAGATFEETDTRKKWQNSGTEWIPQEVGNYLKYRLLKVGTTYYIIDQHGKLIGNGTDMDDILQAAIDAMTPGLLEINCDTGIYAINEPIIIPSVLANTGQKRVIFKGYNWSRRAGTDRHCTQFHISSAFPTDRYVFECNNAPDSDTLSMLEIDGLYVTAVDAFTTKNVGLIKFQVDDIASSCLHINNITGQYMWRGIHIMGGVWRSTVTNLILDENSASFLGDADIILEHGGSTAAENPIPKLNFFQNTDISHGDGQMNNFVRIKSGCYNFFNSIQADGHKVSEAAFNLDASDLTTYGSTTYTAVNTFINPWVLDVASTPTPDNRKGAIYLNGVGCFDNRFIASHVNKVINTVKVSGGALRNRVEIDGIWGGVPIVDSTGAGLSNVIEVTGGFNTIAAAPTDAAVVDTAGLFRIIDYRRGAQKGGSTTITGNGALTAFNIPHTLFAIPAWAIVGAGNAAARDANFSWSYDSANIVVTFSVAPANAVSIILRWLAGVYA